MVSRAFQCFPEAPTWEICQMKLFCPFKYAMTCDWDVILLVKWLIL